MYMLMYQIITCRLEHVQFYSARMSPENTHKLMGFYMEGLILGVNTLYMLFCFFKQFLIGCMGLSYSVY